MPKQDSNILIIDDNPQVLESLQLFLGRHFTQVYAIASPKLLNEAIRKRNTDLILLDMNFIAGRYSGNEGLYLLNELQSLLPETPVILITAYGDVNLAVKGIKAGAFDFVLKPWDNQKLLGTIKAALKLKKEKTKKNKPVLDKTQLTEGVIKGKSPSMSKVWDLVDKVAKTQANVLIVGENGTGKEIIATEIHRQSKRHKGPFIQLDMGAIPETLFESELFGHVKGAFTDAKQEKTGKIEQADKGTLFLDEIANAPLNIQAKLLSCIQQKQITPLGGNLPKSINFRLLAASNKSLHQLCKKGKFREDLLFRINTVQIEVPPLKERKEDIEPLANHFLNLFASKYKKENYHFSPLAIQKLEAYPWPGNVRELKHAIEKAVVLEDTREIKANSFTFHNQWNPPSLHESYNLETMEKQTIQKAIKIYNGNMSKAAKELGISRTTLYAKIDKYGL